MLHPGSRICLTSSFYSNSILRKSKFHILPTLAVSLRHIHGALLLGGKNLFQKATHQFGRTVESATPVFHGHFKQVDSRCRQLVTEQPERFVLGSDVMDYYKQVREDIKSVLGQS
nr:MAG TPA: hypothetical protein [Caudoviricetes sp.]